MQNSSDKSSSTRGGFFKFIIGGIVAAGLLAAWVVGYFQPILLKKYKIMSLENKKVSIEHQIAEYNLQIASLALEEENKKIKKEIAELIEKNEKLDSELAKATDAAENLKNSIASLQKTYQETIQLASISRAEKQKLIDLEKKSSEEIETLDRKIEQLQTDKQDLAENITRLERDLEEKNKLGDGTVLLGGKPVTIGGKSVTFSQEK